jgi:hypothetical protein
MGSDERQVIVEGIAAYAVTYAEMGATENEAVRMLVAHLLRLAGPDPTIIEDAARAVRSMPQPFDETPEEIERARPIREMFGLPTAEDELTAALQAREWLTGLAERMRCHPI